MYQYLNPSHKTHPFTVDPASKLVIDGRDAWVTRAVAQMFDKDLSDEENAERVFQRAQLEVDLRRPNSGSGQPIDFRFVHRKVRYARRRLSEDKRVRKGTRAPTPDVFPDRWWPTYPPNQLPVNWAEDLLADTLDEFFAEVALFNSIGVNDMTAEELLACISIAGPAAPGPQPRLLLAASPGLGKTRGVLERLAKRFARAREIDGDDYVRMNVVYACPTVELAQQNAETYRSFGGRCTVSLGRDYNFDKDPDSTPCKIPRVVRAIQKAGIAGSIQTSLCRKVDKDTGEIEYCHHFHDCAYQRQFDPEADVHFVAHSHLMHVMSEANYGRIELLVIDESFLGHQTTKTKFIPPHELVHDEYGMMVVEAMRNGVNPWHAFRDAGITVAMIEARITTLVASSEMDQPPVFPNITAKRAIEAFHPEKGWRRDPLITVLRRIRDEYKVGREGDEPIRCLAYNPSHPVADKSGTKTTAPMIYLQYRTSFKMLRKDMPVLVLDATGHSTMLAELHIPGIKFHRIEVERKAAVLQATGFTGSMSKMKGENPMYREEAMRVAARFAASYPKLLIGTIKGAIEKGIQPPNDSSAVAHFGGIRGLNKFEGFDAVLIAGRQQMNIHDLENTARALLYDDARSLNLTGSYSTRSSGYFMQCSIEDWESYRRARKAGIDAPQPESWGVNVACHDDPFVEALRFQITEAEIIQMIDRPRWARRSSDGLIVLLTEIPIDGVPVDLLVPYKELVGRSRPGVRLQTAFDKLGVLPPPEMLLRLVRGLWPSVEAVKQELRLAGDVAALLSAKCWQFRVPGRRGRNSHIYARDRNAAVRFLLEHCPEAELI